MSNLIIKNDAMTIHYWHLNNIGESPESFIVTLSHRENESRERYLSIIFDNIVYLVL